MSKPNKSARFNLIAIALVAVAPLVGSYLLYFFWKPEKLVNYGELFGPIQITPANAPPALRQLQGKWLFLIADAASCDAYCMQKLYIIRQLRLTQGKDQERIERVWLVEDAGQPRPEILQEYGGTHVIHAGGSGILGQLTEGSAPRDHIFIVDPLGNVIMRYPRDPDPNKMKKDLSRLLRASRIG